MTARSQKNFFTRYTGVRKQAERAVERIENFIVCPLFEFSQKKNPENTAFTGDSGEKFKAV